MWIKLWISAKKCGQVLEEKTNIDNVYLAKLKINFSQAKTKSYPQHDNNNNI